MTKEELNYKDLSNKQLESLKEIYIASRLSSMTEEDLRKFVESIISDQVNGVVGNEEEREVWKEMKEHFKDRFEEMLKEVLKVNGSATEELSSDQTELGRRLELLEKRQKEKGDLKEDMW